MEEINWGKRKEKRRMWSKVTAGKGGKKLKGKELLEEGGKRCGGEGGGVCGVKKEKRTLEEVGSGGNGKEEKGSKRKVENGKREITKDRIWEGKNMNGKEGEGRREGSKYKRKLWKLNVMSRNRIL